MMAITASIIQAIGSSDADQKYLNAIPYPYEQKKFIFICSGSTKGNISSVEVTPKGRSVSGYHSHIASIDQSKIRLHERTSALPGSYFSEDSIEFELETADLLDDSLYDPLLNVYLKSTITISSLNAIRNIKYDGRKINDRDYTFNDFDIFNDFNAFNDFDQYGKETNVMSFLYNKKFSKNRAFVSPGESRVRAETTGLSQLEFSHKIKDESIVVKDEMYIGKFNISLNNSHKFSLGDKYGYCPMCAELNLPCIDCLSDICEVPCWDQYYYNISEPI